MELPSSSWVVTLRGELNKIASMEKKEDSPNFGCIHKLAASVTDVKAEAYIPRSVSFGPYHHGEPHLKEMEEHKHRTVIQFFKRSKGSIGQFLMKLEKVVDDLKRSYSSLDLFWKENTEDFLKLMTWDGCFMLEILRLTSATDDPSSSAVGIYPLDDPIFSQHGMMYNIPSIKRDMLLLQNQLPLLVLHQLLAVYHGREHTGDKDQMIYIPIHKMICGFFSLPTERIDRNVQTGSNSHLLEVYLKNLAYYRYDFSTIKPNTRSKLAQDCNDDIIWSARSVQEMQDAGIVIRNNKSRYLNRINASISGSQLGLPIIVVDDFTEILLLNIKAFERLQPGIGQEVTGFISFMATIIHDAKDVSLLRSLHIIQNRGFATDEDIVHLFKLLSRDVMPNPYSDYFETQQKIQSYCNRRYSRWKAYINRTYFRNPWSSISLIASIVLFVLTLVQTLYTIFPYYYRL